MNVLYDVDAIVKILVRHKNNLVRFKQLSHCRIVAATAMAYCKSVLKASAANTVHGYDDRQVLW